MAPVPYLRRLVDPLLDELLAHVAAVLIVGPRATGKTTTAERRVRTVIRLGEPAQAAALASDVDAVLATADLPVLSTSGNSCPTSWARSNGPSTAARRRAATS